MTDSTNAAPSAEISTELADGAGGTAGHHEAELEESLIEEVSIDGLCGVY